MAMTMRSSGKHEEGARPRRRPPVVLLAALLVFVQAGHARVPGSPPESTVLRVGGWEANARASFDVASDQVNRRLHFVYADVGKLHHAESSDGGLTWTAPRYVTSGYGQVIAVDGLGTLHLAYEASESTRIEYRTFAEGVWSEARDLSARASPKVSKLFAPRLAVDGNNNVHLMYWALGDVDDSANGNRCVYWYRRNGQAEFDPPELWKYDAARERGWGKYGALAVDPDGHMHIFYAAGRFNHHAIERRVRYSDGRWGRRDHWLGRLLTDWCIGAAVDAAGVVHLAVQTKVGDALKVVYLNNHDDPANLALRNEFGSEDYETFMHLQANDGDLWLVMGHRKLKRSSSEEEAAGMPDIGTYAHFNATTATWSPRTPLSPHGRINLDTRRSGEPRIVGHGGVVRIFYAEKQPEGKWTHWQRVMERRPLLFTTARNAALDFFRRRRVVSLVEITDFTESTVLEDKPDASRALVHQEQLDILADAVRSLSDRCRQVILLRYLDGFSYKEIAAHLGVSPETVKSQLSTGMRRCSEYFASRGLLKTPPSRETASP